jgi:hypothetical protein
MGEAKRRAAERKQPIIHDLDWLKAAELVAGVIDEASQRGMQVILRPTTVRSPHGPSSPIEIVTSADGRSVTITLFDVPEDLRQSFISDAARAGVARIIKEEKA